MPLRPLRECAAPGCRALTRDSRCEAHAVDVKRQRWESDTRETAAERGYGWQWSKVRTYKLKRDPLCSDCDGQGKTEVATAVHHINEDQHDNRMDNLLSLCRECHERRHGRRR